MSAETIRRPPTPAISRTLFLVAGLSCAVQLALLAVSSVGNGALWFFTPDGHLQPTDFAAYRAAASFAMRGEAALAYDPALFDAALAQLFGERFEHALAWLNPPLFLPVIAWLDWPPFALAWALWILATGAVFAAGLRCIIPGWGIALIGFGGPASFACVAKGQSGFLTAGLLGFALALLPRQPFLGGVCLGLLAYKPHLVAGLGLLVLVSGRWRAVAGAALGAAGLAALSVLLFGWAPWQAFLAGAGGTAERFLGDSPALRGMQSAFAFALVWTGSQALAIALHGAVALAAIGVAWRLWRGVPACWDATAAAGIAASFLAAPYAFDHDAVMLTTAAVFLLRAALRDGWLLDEAALLGLALLLPLANFALSVNLLVPVSAALILALALRRAEAVARG